MEAYKTKVLLSIKFREVRGNCTGKTNRYIPECSIVYMFFYFAVSVYLYIYISLKLGISCVTDLCVLLGPITETEKSIQGTESVGLRGRCSLCVQR